MLRPKKKITKKEIQRDPFLETVDQAQAHLEENRSRYLQIGFVILAILIGLNVSSNNSQRANEEASSSLGDALLTMDLNDQTTAKFQLETVINDYDTTIYVEEALHRLVELHYMLGLVDESKKYASLLGYNYQSSEWYEESYKILNKNYVKTAKKGDSKKEQSILQKFKDLLK